MNFNACCKLLRHKALNLGLIFKKTPTYKKDKLFTIHMVKNNSLLFTGNINECKEFFQMQKRGQ